MARSWMLGGDERFRLRRASAPIAVSALPGWIGLALALTLISWMAQDAMAQSPASGPATASAPATAASAPTPASLFGLWVLAPALLSIVLAIVTRQVIVALSLGLLTASAMICAFRGDFNPLHFATTMMDRYILDVLAPVKEGRADLEHLTILIYTLLIGAMIGVMSANGGTRALVARITRRVRSRRTGQFAAIGAGFLVFIDDYASAMIVGPGLRPVFDRLRMSREKLAHIVNWTAAPVSSMFLGTWLAVQIGWIDGGLNLLGGQMPEFLAGQGGANIFWATIPYRTYCILALVLLILLALTGRDFRGVRTADDAALAAARAESAVSERMPEGADQVRANRWYLAAVPGALLVAMTIGLMAQTGHAKVVRTGKLLAFDTSAGIRSALHDVFSNADSHFALLYASLAAAVLAILLTVATRSLTLAKTMEGAVSGMTAMFAATIILVLAWGLSAASKELQLGPVAEMHLNRAIHDGWFSIAWLPVSIFGTACLISLSTGTSWGTMAILLPPVISISAGLLSHLPPDRALESFYACVGAAMAGAVFGNTCSPLADVTVLSATFSGCDLASHCRTVLPPALLVAVVSGLCTDGAAYAIAAWAPKWAAYWNVWTGLGLGTLVLFAVVLIVGRRPSGLICEPAVESGS